MGRLGDKGSHTMMEDEHTLKGIVREKYPGFLIRHSMDLLSQEISLQNTGTNLRGQLSAEQRKSSAGQKRRERN